MLLVRPLLMGPTVYHVMPLDPVMRLTDASLHAVAVSCNLLKGVDQR